MARLTVQFSEPTSKILDELSAQERVSKTEILRRAIALYRYLEKETRDEKRKIAIADEGGNVMKEIVFSLFALFLLPFLASFAINLRNISQPEAPYDLGLRLILLLLVITWSCDTTAYFAGLRWGKHKALERISRDKTVEGFLAGICAACVSSVIFWAIFLDYFSLGHAVVIGLLLGTVGQLGDFFVSLVKRAAKQKDAGALLPGHGGVLDRMDSFLFNAPFMYVLCKSLCNLA